MEETKTATTDIVVATDAGVSVSQALQSTIRFASQMQQSEGLDMTTARRITWLTGNNDCFAANGKTPLPSARGAYIDKPDPDELFPDDYLFIEAMERLVASGLAQDCIVAHPEAQGKPRMTPSWHLPTLSLFVVCEGVPSKMEMNADPKCRWGVAFSGWQQGSKSTLMLNAFVKEIMDVGYFGVFTMRFDSYITDKALACLRAHQEYTLRIADKLRADANIHEPLAYYAYALSIRCSVKTQTAGRQAGKTTEVYYPIPDIPHLSTVDTAMDYLASAAITEQQATFLEAYDRVQRTVEWSVNKSLRLIAGEDVGEDDAMAEDKPPF